MDREKIELLKRIREYINVSPFRWEPAIYIPPAQKLRNAADELEQKERDYKELDELIALLESPNKEQHGKE